MYDNVGSKIVDRIHREKYLAANVHERLYGEAKCRLIRQNIQIEDEDFKERDYFEKCNPSYGKVPINGEKASQRLYYGGLRDKHNKENEIMEAKIYQSELENEDLKFEPEINRISKMIVRAKPRSKSVEQRLMMYGRARLDRNKMLRTVQRENETEGCTFNPAIDKISCQIVNEKSRIMDENLPRHEYLYGLSKINKTRMEQFREVEDGENTFTPYINEYPQGTSQLLDMPFFDRLNYYEQEKDMKYQQLANTYGSGFGNYDNDWARRSGSGQMFNDTAQQYEPFRPRTGRSPVNRNTNNMPVGMYLYERAFIGQKRKELEKEKSNLEIRSKSLSKATNYMSDKIVEAIKYKRLEEIFYILDSDNDGIICNSKIDISGLPTDLLRTLAPLLIEMEQMNLILDLQSFVEAGEKLIRVIFV